MVPSFMFDGLTEELCEAATGYFDWWRQKYDGETVYAFGFYAAPCVEWASIVVFTDEGLRKVANEYKQRGYDGNANKTIEALMNRLRWSAPDSPHCIENEDIFAAVNERLADISEATDGIDDEEAFIRHLDVIYGCLMPPSINFAPEGFVGHVSRCCPFGLEIKAGTIRISSNAATMTRCSPGFARLWKPLVNTKVTF